MAGFPKCNIWYKLFIFLRSTWQGLALLCPLFQACTLAHKNVHLVSHKRKTCSRPSVCPHTRSRTYGITTGAPHVGDPTMELRFEQYTSLWKCISWNSGTDSKNHTTCWAAPTINNVRVGYIPLADERVSEIYRANKIIFYSWPCQGVI